MLATMERDPPDRETFRETLPYAGPPPADRGGRLAIASLTTGVVAWVLGLGVLLTFRLLVRQRLVPASELYPFRFVPALVVLIGGPAALASGVVALLRRTRKKTFAVGGCVLGVGVYAVLIVLARL